MGEEDEIGSREFEEQEDEEEDQMPMRKMVNLAKMYGGLIADKALPLTVFKVLLL